ncbi:hypothetical protein QTQ03_28690 [Micromonospora sp. WMMA1363]|uniref:hypothetical protein n=1 Tax=Micromonospora sp. WMMA1363 TaxID=3053985 RepID=UPI00259CC992|nr:hypothetical protein [Micromonospora sp. WMMA1363]MDM4723291.1 hypothetical protein [Micromonospora sp. WMMA1363]MDM4723385.1 hypothetical protein [Micromonospora sp. WMMA1363]
MSRVRGPFEEGGRAGSDRQPFGRSNLAPRGGRLPDDWDERREEALRLNPQQICHACGLPGGTDLDHKNGDWRDDRQQNLDWIHSWRDVRAGRSKRNCHMAKTGAEGAAARPRLYRPEEVHPAFR